MPISSPLKTMRLFTFSLTSMVLVLAVLYGCAAMMERDPNVIYLLPRESDLPGWKLESPPRRFDGTNIALHEDGDSSLFREYGGVNLAMAAYRSIRDAGEVIAVEIYRMRSPLDAFGIFSRKAGNTMNTPAPSIMCDDIAVIRNGLLLRQGLYCISIVAAGSASVSDPAAFARIILDNIPKIESDLPDRAYLFGGRNRREGLIYYAGAHPDVPLTGGLFTRAKSIDGVEYVVFYSRRSSKSSAIREFAGLLGGGGSGFTLSSAGKRHVSVKDRPDGGYIFAARWEDVIFGLLRAENLVDGNAAINILLAEVSGTTSD
jgi:hypothetical protein